MSRSQLPRSVRKFFRKEKARIRREIFDAREAGERIKKLLKVPCGPGRWYDKRAEKINSKLKTKT